MKNLKIKLFIINVILWVIPSKLHKTLGLHKILEVIAEELDYCINDFEDEYSLNYEKLKGDMIRFYRPKRDKNNKRCDNSLIYAYYEYLLNKYNEFKLSVTYNSISESNPSGETV